MEGARRDERLGHAWVLSGPEGSGKINLALVLARRLLGGDAARPAELPAEAALTALVARHEPEDRHPDLHWLHPGEDKATISVEQVREVIDTLALTAHGGGSKVMIVEPAEAMTVAAANALLKTLEEPSADTYLLLVSHRPGKLPATIRSRCQEIRVGLPTTERLASWLEATPALVSSARDAVGEAPLDVAGVIKRDEYTKYNEIQDIFQKICEDTIDAQAVAQGWAKDRPEVVLRWLKRRLHAEVRLRLAGGSTEVTVPPAATLHNAFRSLPTRTLFEQFDRVDQLLNLLGSGLNVELALQALLNAFVVNRGRS
jgi:DNA polymerase-3 subunit delta'